MKYKIRCVVPSGDVCGEGVVWDAVEAAVYWTDINRFLTHRLDTASGEVRSWFFEEPVVALSLTTEPGRMLVALGSKLIWWWPATDKRSDHGFVLPDSPGVRLNDGRADKQGNLQAAVGKISFDTDKLCENVIALVETVNRLKPSSSKGIYLKNFCVSSTMGPGIKVDPSTA